MFQGPKNTPNILDSKLISREIYALQFELRVFKRSLKWFKTIIEGP